MQGHRIQNRRIRQGDRPRPNRAQIPGIPDGRGEGQRVAGVHIVRLSDPPSAPGDYGIPYERRNPVGAGHRYPEGVDPDVVATIEGTTDIQREEKNVAVRRRGGDRTTERCRGQDSGTKGAPKTRPGRGDLPPGSEEGVVRRYRHL